MIVLSALHGGIDYKKALNQTRNESTKHRIHEISVFSSAH